MKRLLASGQGDIYEMGRVFRAGESGRYHNPEFTLLEWYRRGWKYLDLADEVIELVRFCSHGEFGHWPAQRVSYRGIFQQETGLDPLYCSESDLASCAMERGILATTMDHQDWLDLLLAELIQPALPGETFTVLYDFPPEQAALARIRDDQPAVAERFEVYLGQMELANGYGGYLPPPSQHKLGGYETWPARSSFLEVAAEPQIREAISRLLHDVHRQP